MSIAPKILPKAVIVGFFLLGLLSSVAFRAITSDTIGTDIPRMAPLGIRLLLFAQARTRDSLVTLRDAEVYMQCPTLAETCGKTDWQIVS